MHGAACRRLCRGRAHSRAPARAMHWRCNASGLCSPLIQEDGNGTACTHTSSSAAASKCTAAPTTRSSGPCVCWVRVRIKVAAHPLAGLGAAAVPAAALHAADLAPLQHADAQLLGQVLRPRRPPHVDRRPPPHRHRRVTQPHLDARVKHVTGLPQRGITVVSTSRRHATAQSCDLHE